MLWLLHGTASPRKSHKTLFLENCLKSSPSPSAPVQVVEALGGEKPINGAINNPRDYFLVGCFPCAPATPDID
jgi:hypothetical protein